MNNENSFIDIDLQMQFNDVQRKKHFKNVINILFLSCVRKINFFAQHVTLLDNMFLQEMY